ncbi:MAG: tRNA-specific adenosine deaminase [Flavobacteriaceae bacterium]|nr:MAG: tRNA-specific adenosine deaminase [Flavobacteriaceae bacterium]
MENEPSVLLLDHAYFMRKALSEAVYAASLDEVPVGVVVVCQNKIIAKGYNLTQQLNDVTAHAEMQAITSASNYLGAKYLTDCILYVTLEPCLMCAGALAWAQIGTVVFGAKDKEPRKIELKEVLHPKTKLISGVLEEECGQLLTEFFLKKRN